MGVHPHRRNKNGIRQDFTVGQTDVPGNPKHYLRHVVTSATGAGNFCIVRQKIEDVQSLAGETATLTFWAKADAARDIATEFLQAFGSGGSPSADVRAVGTTTHSLTTSWQKFSVVVSIPSISGKTIGTNEDSRLVILFWFDGGSDFDSRNNSLGHQSGTFDIAHVSLVKGDASDEDDPFGYRPMQQELALCQRYYQTRPSCGGAIKWHGYGDVRKHLPNVGIICSPNAGCTNMHSVWRVINRVLICDCS